MTDSEILPDLAEVIAECKTQLSAIDPDQEVAVRPQKVEALIAAYKTLNPRHSIALVGGHSFVIKTGEQTRHISVQEMPALSILADNLRALDVYAKALDSVAKDMGFTSRTGDGAGFFGLMPGEDWQTKANSDDRDKFLQSVENVFTDVINKERILKFVTDPDWSGMRKEDGTIGRKLNRATDWQESAVLKTGGLVAAASAGRVNLIRAIEQAGFGADLVTGVPSRSQPEKFSFVNGENVIFYGAPGTGKSNRVDTIVSAAGKKAFRTVFHPDLQNSDFFGCLKPHMDGNNVRYEFSPGPFMEALAEAFKTPEEPVYLVIEELNRAAAAAVFGDLFLLLDRDENGHGQYDVNFPSRESKKWFNKETGTDYKTLHLPSNLFIYATMNSADQGVYPIDTAFRRRWRQEYLPLDYEKGPEGEISYIDAANNSHVLSWREFAKLLKDYLTASHTLDIAEDRLLGQWFVKRDELNDIGIPEKVLLYLWDDLLRHEGREEVFDSGVAGKVKTYGDLVVEASAGRRFLSDRFLALLNAASDVKAGQPEKTDHDAS